MSDFDLPKIFDSDSLTYTEWIFSVNNFVATNNQWKWWYTARILCFNNSSKEIVLLQPLCWRCVECVIHHERDVRKEQNYINVVRTSNNRVTSSGDLYCCSLPQCKALRTCRSGFPIATKWCCDQDVECVPGLAFAQRTCDRCGSSKKGGDVIATSPLALRWMCDSPRTGCARSTKLYKCGANKQ